MAFFSLPALGWARNADPEGCLTATTPFDGNAALEEALALKADPSLGKAAPIEKIYWKARRIVYVGDARADKWQAPGITGSRMAGDCEDKALWLYRQLKLNGYGNIRLIIGRYRAHDATTHAWVTHADEKGRTYVLDPTQNNRIWPLQRFKSGFYVPLYSYDGALRYKHVDPMASTDAGCIDYPSEALARLRTVSPLSR